MLLLLFNNLQDASWSSAAAFPQTVRTALVSCLLATSLWGSSLVVDPSSTTAWAETGLDVSTGKLQPCPYESNCVSSNYLEPPNRYLSPLQTQRDKDKAFDNAVRDLLAASGKDGIAIAETSPKNHYIHLTMPGTAPSSLDDVEMAFVDNGDSDGSLVNLRCQARVTLPPPPFCVQKNCINGNMDQRRRVETITQILGIPKADQESMKGAKWTPIFLNSDRVPGFDDDKLQ